MKDLKPTCRIAVVQAAPVLFDKTACTDKAVRLIAECAQHGAELIVFPELFIPGYPYGMTFGFTVGERKRRPQGLAAVLRQLHHRTRSGDGAPRRGGKGRVRVCEHRRVGARRRDGHAL